MEIYRDSMNSKSDLTLSNISLMEIIRNTRGDYDLIKNANYIPQIEEIDGTVFVNTECKSYINDNRGDYIKYLILDEDMQLTHDSDSPGYVFARLHTYLVRLVLPRALPEPEGIYIDYIINVNNNHYGDCRYYKAIITYNLCKQQAYRKQSYRIDKHKGICLYSTYSGSHSGDKKNIEDI